MLFVMMVMGDRNGQGNPLERIIKKAPGKVPGALKVYGTPGPNSRPGPSSQPIFITSSLPLYDNPFWAPKEKAGSLGDPAFGEKRGLGDQYINQAEATKVFSSVALVPAPSKFFSEPLNLVKLVYCRANLVLYQGT